MRCGPPCSSTARQSKSCIQTGGGEYLSTAFDQHLAKAGTAHKLTMHDTPQLNGIAEHLNHTLLECIHAFTHSSGLPKSLWGKALWHATWLKNQTVMCTLDGKTPFEALYGQLLDLYVLQSWGTIVLVHNAARLKLDVLTHKAHWLGLDVDARAHRVFWPGAGNVTVEHSVYFRATALLEGEQNNLSIAGSEQAATPHITPITPISTTLPLSTAHEVPSAIVPLPAHISQPKQPSEEPTQLQCSGHIHFPSCTIRKIEAGKGIDPTMHKVPQPKPEPVDPDMPGLTPVDNEPDEDEVEDLVKSVWTVFQDAPVLLEDFPGLEYAFAAKTADAEVLEPCTLADAKHRPDWPLWEKAIEEELATLKAAGTWRLEEALPGANIIGSKWVFKVKKDATGNVVCYKARLVT